MLADVSSRASSNWPSIEVSETGDDIKVVAEVPGLDKGDVEVTLHDGVLALRGEKKLERNGTRYGVLTVALSKKPESQREVKRITVK